MIDIRTLCAWASAREFYVRSGKAFVVVWILAALAVNLRLSGDGACTSPWRTETTETDLEDDTVNLVLASSRTPKRGHGLMPTSDAIQRATVRLQGHCRLRLIAKGPLHSTLSEFSPLRC